MMRVWRRFLCWAWGRHPDFESLEMFERCGVVDPETGWVVPDESCELAPLWYYNPEKETVADGSV